MAWTTGCGAAGSSAELVILNARVWTGVPATPDAQAIAVRGGRIVAVGTTPDIRRHVGPRSRVIDAGGRRVIPGLIDSHAHIISGGQQLGRLNLREVGSKAEFVAAVADRAGRTASGNWVLGGRWSVESWSDPRTPTRHWIDPVTPNVPVLLSRMDGHGALSNTAALELAGITIDGPPDPPGGEIERDPHTGSPTGILKDAAIELVAVHVPEPTMDERYAALQAAMRHANRFGITGLHDMSEPEDLAVFARAQRAGAMSVRIHSFYSCADWPGAFDTVSSYADSSDGWFRVAGFKGYMDGSLGSRTAYMREPFADAAADEKYPRGLPAAMATPPENIRHQIVAADARGFQIVAHAIGDEANHILLDAYAEAARVNPSRPRRHRVEHAQHLLPEDIPRFARSGVIASMQPLHKADDGRYAEVALGPSRLESSYAFRSLLDSGAKLCFGSDWPVVSINPFLGMAAAVTSRTLEGKLFVPSQSIGVEEALAAYTVTAAYAAGLENKLGTIEPGKLADLVILDRDILAVAPDQLADTRVTHTIVGGRVVYEAEPNVNQPADERAYRGTEPRP